MTPQGHGANGFLHEVLGGIKSHIGDGFKTVETFVRSRTLKTRTSQKGCLEQAVVALEAVAHRKKDGGHGSRS
jgi:hypothetical protein